MIGEYLLDMKSVHKDMSMETCPELGSAYVVMLQPIPATPWCWALWVHS